MWDVTNRTPFSVFAGFDRDSDGRAYWLVWAKATFLMRHERPCLFEPEQIALFREPRFRGASDSTDLIADSDICFPKAKPDVLLTGYGRRPTGSADNAPYDVAVSIGDWAKSLTVLPPMRWSQHLRAEETGTDAGAVFLGFRNAYGGVDSESDAENPREFAENPIGQGFWATPAAARGKSLPRLVRPGEQPQKWDAAMTPYAFACVPKPWPARARYSGTCDDAWLRRKSPLLPDDFDTRYWQSVSEDQQLATEPPESTVIELRNVAMGGADTSNGVFTAELPRLTFELFTRFKGKWQETEMALQTVHLLPEQNLVTLGYCGALPIRATGNDVLVDESELTLRGHSGFRVRPEDIDRFDPTSTEASA